MPKTNDSHGLTRTEGASPASWPMLALAVASCCWGTGFFFGKIAFAEMTVTENLCYRYLFASMMLLPMLARRRERLSGAELWQLLTAAFFGVPVQMWVQYEGLERTTVSHASLIIGAIPVLLAASSALFLKERLRTVEWGLMLLSTLGAVFIALSHGAAGTSPRPAWSGDVLVLCSLFAAVVMILCTKRLLESHNSLFATTSIIVSGTAMLWIMAEASQPVRYHFSVRTWAAVGAQAILATVLSYLFWNWGLERVPAARAGIFLNLEPVVGSLLGIALLRERLGWGAIAGGLLIIASAVYFSTRRA